ncbi:hypothetical protein PhCBS80983_g00100 [Powellomyces hirtus]|uniref:VASt domain-containing protein n=1 Tax=Powellomyces hirtus TaxID=109895 RepID=A0A507EGD9_9FUNG|nr:hypothetical protein PhCBS80983_g00100 [Powellomyces hirtus]
MAEPDDESPTSSTPTAVSSSPALNSGNEIKRPEPAANAANGEVRRVFSLGTLNPSLRDLGFGSKFGAVNRSVSVGSKSIPQLINPISAESAATTSDVSSSSSPETGNEEVRTALPRHPPLQGENAGPRGVDGVSSTPSTRSGSRRASTSKPKSGVNRNEDLIAEAAVLLASVEGDESEYASKKRNADFHELFPSLPRDDLLVEDYSCAWQKEVLIQGRMYLSQRHICFYANILGWTHSVEIPFTEIVALDKKYVAAIIPNSLEISTVTTKYFFASLMNRDNTFTMIKGLWDIAAHKTFQLRPIAKSAGNLLSSHDDDEQEADEDRGRDLEVPEPANGSRSLSLDSLQERLKMGGDQVKKRVAAYMNDIPSTDTKPKPRDSLSKQAKPSSLRNSMVETTRPDESIMVPSDASGDMGESKSRSSSLPELIIKDQVQILVNGEVSDATSPTEHVVSNGPPLPDRAPLAISPTSDATGSSRDGSPTSNGNSGTESAPDTFSTPREAYPETPTSMAGTPATSQNPHIHIDAPAHPHKTHMPPASCDCGPAHDKMISVLDTAFPISVKTLWRLMYDQKETTEGFLKSFLEGKRKCRDFMFHDWVPPDKELPEPTEEVLSPEPAQFENLKKGWQRRLENVVPLNNSLGPKQTRCKLHETVWNRDDHRSICIEQISRTPDVPSGASFQSRVKLCLTAAASTETRLRVSCEVEWLKSSWLKTPINSAVPEGLKEYHAELEKAIIEYIQASPEEAESAPIAEEEVLESEMYSGSESGSETGYYEDEDVHVATSADSASTTPSLSGLSHPLEKEMAELDRTALGLRARFPERAYAQSPDRGLCGKQSASNLRFSTSTPQGFSTFTRSFTPSGGKKGKNGRPDRGEWWNALRIVVRGIGGWTALAGICATATLVFCCVIRGFVRWEVQRAIREMDLQAAAADSCRGSDIPGTAFM